MDSNSDVAEVKALTDAKVFLRQAETALRAATDAVIAANPYDNKVEREDRTALFDHLALLCGCVIEHIERHEARQELYTFTIDPGADTVGDRQSAPTPTIPP